MDRQTVIEFFNKQALTWDENSQHDPAKINTILDYAEIGPNISVLDVACGTGVLFPYYIEREVDAITGVDISPAMIEQAKSKFDDARITLICQPVEDAGLKNSFDRALVYSGFPHFPDPALLIKTLAIALKPDGRLTIAHSQSREKIIARHEGKATNVSLPLPQAEELAAMLSPYFHADVVLSDNNMYVVSGLKV